MTFRAIALAALVLPAAGCADFDDAVWTRSERLALAPGKDFAHCTAAAIAGVPGLTAADAPAMKAYFDGYLVLGGTPVDGLPGMVGDLSLRGSTIQVELTSRPHKLPDESTRAAADRLVAELRARVASQCS